MNEKGVLPEHSGMYTNFKCNLKQLAYSICLGGHLLQTSVCVLNIYIVAEMKEKRLEWTGHVVRMDQGRSSKKIFESKPEVS